MSTPTTTATEAFNVAEYKVKTITEIIECDPDELLGLAGRVASDLIEIIRRHPQEIAALIRVVKGLPAEEMGRLAEKAKKEGEKSSRVRGS